MSCRPSLAALLTLLTPAVASFSFACSGTVVDPGNAVTNLPSSDQVADDASQFCSDFVSYFEQNESPILQAACADSVASATSNSECETVFNDCVSDIDSMAATFNSELSTEVMPACTSSISKCTGVTVGQASDCITDYVNAWVASAKTVTVQAICVAHDNIPAPALPASCASLPSDCTIGSSSVSVSMGSSGGSSSGGK
jgi:hypothetical protein